MHAAGCRASKQSAPADPNTLISLRASGRDFAIKSLAVNQVRVLQRRPLQQAGTGCGFVSIRTLASGGRSRCASVGTRASLLCALEYW